uniref:right-handed parallel beta-helix repeat-containing protein n=1 Tax=Paenibacillus forsythiae TaxID=365616 RepID=UPI000472D6D2
MKAVTLNKILWLPLIAALIFGLVGLMPPGRAAAAGTTYYVDAAAGDDANSGTSEESPWKSLDKVNSVVFDPGDRILLKAGSVWNNAYLDLKGSGTEGSPIVVDRYGFGPKPLIHFGNTAVGGEGFGVRLKNVSYWEINNLEITSGQHATDMRRSGILVVGEGAGAGAVQHIYIKGNDIHDVFGTDRRTGGINFHARGGNTDPESTWDDVLIEDNTVINVADTGIQVMTDAFANTSWAHKFDAFTRLIIRGNYVEKIHRDGILVRAGVSPLIEYNTTSEIGVSCDVNTSVVNYLDTIGYVAAQWAYYTTGAVFQHNEAFNTRVLQGDGQAWDFDIRVSDSIYQYNFSHHNEGGALLVMDSTNNNIFRYNISQNDYDAFGAFNLRPGGGSLYIYNNVIYRDNGISSALTKSSTSGMAYYSNNIFYNAVSGTYTNSSYVKYSHNLFYGANANVPSDPGKVVGDPLFLNGGAASGIDTASAYQLAEGSPAINAGAIIWGNGGADFFGNPLYGGAPDIGVYEAPGTANPEAAVLEDDFEDGMADGWATVGGSWDIGTEDSLVYAQNGLYGEAIAFAGEAFWTDYSLEADVKVKKVGGNAGILFRY